MAIAEGMRRQFAYKKETAWGVIPVVLTGAQIIRRVTAMFNLKKETYESAEIRTDFQTADYRHGSRSVEGSISGELSPGSYSDFLSSFCAKAFVAGVATAALTNVTAAVTTGNQATYTRATGSYLTDGFKVGDIVRWTGWATTGTANNSTNMQIIALTATIMTTLTLTGLIQGSKAAGDSVTCTVVGKKTLAPLTGHTDDSYTFEDWNPSITQSEVFSGCKISTLAIDVPANGMVKIDIAFMGKDLAQTGTAQFYTTPSAPLTSGILAGAQGSLLVNGIPTGLITGIKINGNRNNVKDQVVGSLVAPDLFEGRITVDGEFTAYFQDGVMRDMFVNETIVTLCLVLTTSTAPTADFVSIVLPAIKVGGADKDDGEKGIIRTYPFKAILNVAGGAALASDQTTISIQDSLA